MTLPTVQTDVISDLAGVQPGYPLAELRAQRPKAAAHAQGSYDALFSLDATPKQAAALVGSRGNSPYFRLLALDVDVLTERLGLDPRRQALVDLAVALAATPPSASAPHVTRLRDLGLSDLEILDVMHAGAFFAWANRLMLTLGEPYYADA